LLVSIVNALLLFLTERLFLSRDSDNYDDDLTYYYTIVNNILDIVSLQSHWPLFAVITGLIMVFVSNYTARMFSVVYDHHHLIPKL